MSDGDAPPRVHIEHDIDLTLLTATDQTEPAVSSLILVLHVYIF